MTNKQKQELVKFLFPREDIRTFLINDVYMELAEIIPPYILFEKQNIDKKVREQNYLDCYSKVESFLDANKIYLTMLKEQSYEEDIKGIIDYLLVGYSFYVSQTNDIFRDIDIFKDERSICYREVSILDVL